MAGERRIPQPIQSKSENGDKMRFGKGGRWAVEGITSRSSLDLDDEIRKRIADLFEQGTGESA